MMKPTGPETYEIGSGDTSIWPNLRHVHRSHREDLETVLRRRDRSPDEFYISDTPSWIDSPRFERNGVTHGPVATEVVVRSRKTGVARAYIAKSTGPTTTPFAGWVEQFAEDLDNGLFE